MIHHRHLQIAVVLYQLLVIGWTSAFGKVLPVVICVTPELEGLPHTELGSDRFLVGMIDRVTPTAELVTDTVDQYKFTIIGSRTFRSEQFLLLRNRLQHTEI